MGHLKNDLDYSLFRKLLDLLAQAFWFIMEGLRKITRDKSHEAAYCALIIYCDNDSKNMSWLKHYISFLEGKRLE